MNYIKLIFFFLSVILFTACNHPLKVDDDYNKGYKKGYEDGITANAKVETKADVRTKKVTSNDDHEVETNSAIPQKVYETFAFIKKNNRAPDNFVGGRHFGNFEQHLPEQDASGNKIDYKEYDVNPKIKGKNRGVERLVIGDDGKAWYTNNHYKTFTEVK